MRKTRHNKNNKKVRKTYKKRNNYKQKGGELGDTASYLNNHIFIGYRMSNFSPNNNWMVEYPTSASIFVPKNYDFNILHLMGNFFDKVVHPDHTSKKYYENTFYGFYLNDLAMILKNIYSANGNVSVMMRPMYGSMKCFLVLPYLNLLPNLRNLNIYRLIIDGNIIMDESENIYITHMLKNAPLTGKIADYIDLKYHNIVYKSEHYTGNSYRIPTLITNENKNSFIPQNKSIVEYTNELKKEILDQLNRKYPPNDQGIEYDIYSTNINRNKHQIQFLSEIQQPTKNGDNYDYYLVSLKEFIMKLERMYPSLIGRVLLETDAELAGEEPRSTRMMRASETFEKGMQKIEKPQSEQLPEQNL